MFKPAEEYHSILAASGTTAGDREAIASHELAQKYASTSLQPYDIVVSHQGVATSADGIDRFDVVYKTRQRQTPFPGGQQVYP